MPWLCLSIVDDFRQRAHPRHMPCCYVASLRPLNSHPSSICPAIGLYGHPCRVKQVYLAEGNATTLEPCKSLPGTPYSMNIVSDLQCPVVQPLTRIRTFRCVTTDQVLGTIPNHLDGAFDRWHDKRSRPRDLYSCLYSADNPFPEDLFFPKNCVACLACLACATRSRTYIRNGNFPLKAGACSIDDELMALPGPLIVI